MCSANIHLFYVPVNKIREKFYSEVNKWPRKGNQGERKPRSKGERGEMFRERASCLKRGVSHTPGHPARLQEMRVCEPTPVCGQLKPKAKPQSSASPVNTEKSPSQASISRHHKSLQPASILGSRSSHLGKSMTSKQARKRGVLLSPMPTYYLMHEPLL